MIKVTPFIEKCNFGRLARAQHSSKTKAKNKNNNNKKLVWWCTPMILVLGRLRQEDCKFEISLGYIERLVSGRGWGTKPWKISPFSTKLFFSRFVVHQ
jgi:hypothetical protein